MARRAKAKTPPADASPPMDDVFDTAAPPPPQLFVKAPKGPMVLKETSATKPTRRGHGDPGTPSSPLAGSQAGPPASGAAGAGAGPWYTCGLGASLLAQAPGLFALAVVLTYSAGIGFLLLLLWLILRLCFGDCGCEFECCDCTCEGCCDDGCCCDDCCSDGGGSGGSDGTNRTEDDSEDIPGAGFAVATGGLASAFGWSRLSRRGAMAHHPDLPAFARDVVRWGGERWCVGCITVYPVFAVASAGLLAAGPLAPWGPSLAAGLLLAGTQAVSALGWARRRAAKVAVKASLGLGMALALHGILDAPWPRPFQVGALVLVLGAAFASAWPRRRRIAAAVAAAEQHPGGR